MKIKNLSIRFIIIALTGISLFSSCKKDDTKDEKDNDTSSASDQALATSISNDMVNISDEACKTYSVSSFKTSETSGILAASCATITVDTVTSPKKITVNFGSFNCTCNDGRTRRGSLEFSFTGKYRDSLTLITVTPQNYFVNDNQVAGSKTITNKGHNSANHLVYEIHSNLQIIKAGGAGNISWQSVRYREWTAGESTISWNDDIYSITGTASGMSAGGSTFSSNIITPLIRNMSFACRRHFVSGILEHTPTGRATRSIDFGTGTCDNQATVTINGVVYTITLP
jgi:hypothetical protein